MGSDIWKETKKPPLFICSNSHGDHNPTIQVRRYLKQGRAKEAFQVYKQLRCNRSFILNLVPLLVKSCASFALQDYGKSLHAESIKFGLHSDVVVGTSFVGMYGKIGGIRDACKVFNEMVVRNVVTWNAMIGGYFRNGDVCSASMLFNQMGIRSEVTWIEMIDGFARNGDLVTARKLFNQVPVEMRTVVTWTVMIDGYSSNGDMESAKEFFEAMPERNFFVWSSMISGYCKIGNVEQAKAIFDQIPVKNLVNWNSLISGYAQNGYCIEALDAFEQMQSEGFSPDEITIVGALSACAQNGSLEYGKKIHNMIHDKMINHNQFVANALVDMYAKCGDLESAIYIFQGMNSRNCACWNAMISGFAVNGQSREAIEFFKRMEGSHVKPDELTFLSVLSACAHGGLVDEGMTIFSQMENYGLVPNIKHYGCLVDLLARSGRLREAYSLIKSMPMEPNDAVLGSMLGACRIHLNLDIVQGVVDEVRRLNCKAETTDELHYLSLSNIYAASEGWENAERMRATMVNNGFRKAAGCSSITFQ
ncbi:hypothetical protein SAY87_019051 [Trapa incisa]|uniref:Pentatricopeptide repeat-containing protein n=1 Tax=Trapa incisa TaxID=236973 RepID=A0AAN7K6D6_9MYRT|nr:hypothetical protein SAY87_019051 [Trapa incisa]